METLKSQATQPSCRTLGLLAQGELKAFQTPNQGPCHSRGGLGWVDANEA